ncbi:hypothetical protein Tco_1353012 [Tanacetum coccineum]
MQKTFLKQQYENFTTSRSEGLDKTYDRFQKLISQLEIHGEVISQEDANLKLLRSLPFSLNNIASPCHASTNEAVNTAHDVPAARSKGQASSSTYADDVIEDLQMGMVAMLTMRVEGDYAEEDITKLCSNGLYTSHWFSKFIRVQTMSQMNENELHDCHLNKSKVFNSASDSSVNEIEEENNQVNDRFKKVEGYHAVPPPYTGNYMPSRTVNDPLLD